MVFDDGNTFIDCIFIAPVQFGEGTIFVNPQFECQTGCNNCGGCCPPVSEVGVGAVVSGGGGQYVQFDPASTMSDFTLGPCGNVTLPDCVDCTSNAEGAAITTTGTEVVVSSRGALTYEEWCEKCGMAGVLWDEDDVETAP